MKSTVTIATLVERLKAIEAGNSPFKETQLTGLRKQLTELRDQKFVETMKRASSKSSYGANSGAWWEACQLMYPLMSEHDGQPGLFFRSEAADWNEPEAHVYGPFGSDYDRLKYIIQLIQTKASDRRRGIGNTDADFERVAPKYEALEAA
jgi:thymidylate synthase